MPDSNDRPKPVRDLPSGIDNLTPEERKAFLERLSKLDDKLDGINASRKSATESEQDQAMRSKGMAMGLRMSTELVAAIAVGGLIGYGLDKWLNTSPWLFLLFFFLGFAAGIINVVRAFNKMQADIAKATGGNIGRDIVDNDDD